MALAAKEIQPGEVHAFTEEHLKKCKLSDGQEHLIKFYKLADNRGWVHDVEPNCESRTITISGSKIFILINIASSDISSKTIQ